MVLLQVDVGGILSVELECDAPRPVDMHRVASGFKSSQGMKVEARQIHVFRTCRCVQAVEPGKDAPVHPGVDPGTLPGLEEARQRLMPEGLDHDMTVSRLPTP